MKNSEKLETLMAEKELKTLDDVRDYLRGNLTLKFVNKQIFDALNITIKPWLSSVDDIKKVATKDKDFRKYCNENFAEAADTWKTVYFSYCCLDYAGRRVLRHLTKETYYLLKSQNITMDFELLDKLHEGIQPKHLGVTNDADLEIINNNFLNYCHFYPLDASPAHYKIIYDRYAYMWYTMVKGLSAQSLQYLKMRRLMSEAKIAKALNLDQKSWDFIRIRRHVRKDMVKSNIVDIFNHQAFVCKNEKGEDVYALALTEMVNSTDTRDARVLYVVKYTPNGVQAIRKAACELHLIGNKCINAQWFVTGICETLKDDKVTDIQSFIEVSGLPEFIVKPLFDRIAEIASEEFGIN